MKKYKTHQIILIILLPFIAVPLLYFLAKGAFAIHFHPPCLLYQLTGIVCPGCGMTRAVFALLKGDVLFSLRQNALIIVGLLITLWLYVELLFRAFAKKPPFTILKLKYLWIFLALVVIYTVLRNFIPILAPLELQFIDI